MKVISPGIPFITFRHTCTVCGALLEVEEADIKCYYYAGDQRERSYSTFSAICPCCDHPFTILEDNITSYLKTRLLKAARGW